MDYLVLKEERLIKKSQRGDTKAFDEIINRNSEYVLGWTSRMAKDPLIVEELFQITMIKCWKNIKKFKGNSAFKTWACAIARNLFIDKYRENQRRKAESLDAIASDGREKLGPCVDPEFLGKYKNEDLNIFLGRVMSKLSSDHSNALRYFAVEGLTYQEIAKIQKCSIGTVMSRLFYARKKARELIKANKNYKLYYGND
jgi:RNA polymerase sigma-70 factor (ECF subfamily)